MASSSFRSGARWTQHPAYDAFWQGQALDKIMAQVPLKVPVDVAAGPLGPGRHVGRDPLATKPSSPKTPTTTRTSSSWDPGVTARSTTTGYSLGPLLWDGDTTLQFRRDVLLPFFNQYLLDNAPKADTPPVFIYNTGENHWDRFKSWPLSCDANCPNKSQPLYLTANGGLSFDSPARIVAEV